MAESGGMRKLLEQLTTLWRGMSRGRQVLLVGAAVVVAGAITTAAIFLGGPRYEPVFTGLGAEDLRAVTVALERGRVAFSVDDTQGAVYVPGPQVHAIRLDLAMQGLPKSSVVGFEILKETNLGLTDFERRLRYYWALQGELTRTVRSIEGVQDARVHIVIPERSLFVSEQQPATASVLVDLAPGATLSRSQVRGIVHLVANSVESLSPEHVTVVDARGNILSELLGEDGTSPSSSLIAEQLQLKRNYERELERSLQATLEQVWGAGQVLVRVTADLSFDRQEEMHEIFSPAVNGRSGIVRSEQRTEESYEGQGTAGASGVPGVTSNIPGYVAPAAGDGSSTMQRLDSVINYEINRVERRIVMAPGRVQRLSAAVWVNASLDALQRQRMEQLVASALGLQPDRGDQVTVESVPFGQAAQPGTVAEGQLIATRGAAPAVQGVFWWLLAVAFAIAVAWWVTGRMQRARRRALAPAVPLPGQIAVEVPSAEELHRRQIRQDVERLARERPEEFVQLLRSWLVEET